MLQKLPLGVQSFANIRNENMVYVDKTERIYQLVTQASFYFLSRPRRFGKSLLVSTLTALFSGRRELFKGLWIDEHGAWKWQTYPIVTFDFNVIAHDTAPNLQLGLEFYLKAVAQHHAIPLSAPSLKGQFQELILGLYEKTGQPVVILVDEYDKPLIEHLGRGEARLETAKANRDILRHLFGVLKGADVAPALRFVFLTGVSRFSRVSIFSELNNLHDISMLGNYADLLGYTQTELERYFPDHLTVLADTVKLTYAELLQKLTYYYNGYRFSTQNVKVYNPFSMLNALMALEIRNYWFETGTPTFLINLLYEAKFDLPILETLEVDALAFNTFDLERLRPTALLFQTGYLTIKEVDDEIYTLSYPNYEVKQSFNRMLLETWTQAREEIFSSAVLRLNRYLSEDKLPEFIKAMQTVFASIPYDVQINQNEGYYHTIFYVMMAASGSQARNSLLSNQGRLDMAVFFRQKMYIFEFKCNQSATVALEQIKAKGYALPYHGSYEQITLVGINFSTEKRNVTEWLAEQDKPESAKYANKS